MRIRGLEAEAGQDAHRLRLELVAAELLEAGGDLRVLVEQPLLLVGLGVLQASLDLPQPIAQRGDALGAAQHVIEHRLGLGDRVHDVLGQVADPGASWPRDRALVGLAVTEHDVEERGLAHAVAAHERDTAARGHLERDP